MVSSHRPTYQGLCPTESIKPNVELGVRFPTGISWAAELRLLFAHFLVSNARTHIDGPGGPNKRQVLPYTTLLHASRIKPMLFASLVLQRVFDAYMPWPEPDNNVARWKVCNFTKLPVVKPDYPVDDDRVAEIRARLNAHRASAAGFQVNMSDFLPDILSPEERDILQVSREVDNRFEKDSVEFMQHCM